MRVYLVKASTGAKRYGGTQADAKGKRDGLMEQEGLKKSSVTIEEVEVPTAKPLLLDFINGLCEEQDKLRDTSDGG